MPSEATDDCGRRIPLEGGSKSRKRAKIAGYRSPRNLYGNSSPCNCFQFLCSKSQEGYITIQLLFTPDLQAGITDTFHLINTIRVSTNRLVQDVRNVVAAGATDKVIEALYEMPSSAGGQNLRAFSAQTSAQHEAALANLWLFIVIGHYEVWADDLPVPNSDTGCQFPTRGFTSLSTKPGIGDVFDLLPLSRDMSQAYGTSLDSEQRLLGTRTNDAMTIYRLYKECRNSLAHSGGRASERVENWSNETAARAVDLHVDRDGNQIPLPYFRENDRMTISITQVRCLVSILFRLAVTIDAKILLSTIGASEITARWHAQFGVSRVNVEPRKLRSIRWLTARLQEAHIPIPNNPQSLIDYLVSQALVRELI